MEGREREGPCALWDVRKWLQQWIRYSSRRGQHSLLQHLLANRWISPSSVPPFLFPLPSRPCVYFIDVPLSSSLSPFLSQFFVLCLTISCAVCLLPFLSFCPNFLLHYISLFHIFNWLCVQPMKLIKHVHLWLDSYYIIMRVSLRHW